MATPTTFVNDVLFQSNVTFTGTIQTKFDRTQLAQEPLASYPVKLTDFRVFDAFQTNLPGTAASDDLGLVGGAFGTGSPTLQSSDSKAASVTQYARCMITMPPEYDSGETVTIRVHAGMNTTISDGTATVDVECYEVDQTGGIGSDLCTTNATSINSTTNSDKDFSITASGLAPGDILDVRITIAITDTATGTAVIGEIGSVELLCDIRG